MVTLSRASLGTGRLQFLNEPERVEVQSPTSNVQDAEAAGETFDVGPEALDSPPSAVLWQRRWRRVIEILERWRIDDEWWRSEPVSRMYYAVLLEGGKRLELYHDLVGGQWYAQR